MKAPGILLGLALTVQAAALQDSPVTRVVGLLKDLQARIEKDGKSEQETYDKYACWCEKTTGKTAATITSVKSLLKKTGTTILKLKGSVAVGASEIKGLAEDIKKNQQQQAEQTNVREKENTAFMAEKVELESALGALEKAIAVLKAASGASFIQSSVWATTVSDLLSKMSEASLRVKLDERQMDLLSKLSGKDAYAPQSATIQGILSDMYATFGKNLQTGIADEATAHRNYEDLMATFQKQLATLQETLVKKETKKTEDEIQLADATQTYADSEDQLKAEIKLFDATKKSCTEKTEDWSTRSSLRTKELEGITEALKILESDEAKDLFGKAIKPGISKGGAASFLQVSSQSAGVKKALQTLESSARQSQSLRLATIAAQVRSGTTGHFDAVIKAIDKMLVQLKEEEEADTAKVDKCREEYQEIGLAKNDLDWKIENNEAKIQKHQKAIDEKTDAKEVTIKDIADADKTLKEMADKRKAENDAYLQAKDDDEKAIALLEKAKTALAAYGKSFLQSAQEPEAKFSDKDSAKVQTKGVLSLLDMIIEDLNNELAESKAAEAAAQTDYESMKQAVEEQREKLDKARINLKAQIAEEGSSKVAEEDLKKENNADLSNEKKTEEDLKKTCDDAIKLQPERRKKRKVEADGLTQAKEFLAGASADALMQTKGKLSKTKAVSFLQQKLSL